MGFGVVIANGVLFPPATRAADTGIVHGVETACWSRSLACDLGLAMQRVRRSRQIRPCGMLFGDPSVVYAGAR
jgi:hypothetical protein